MAAGDEKIIAVPSPKLTQRYVHVKTTADLPEITRQQIEHFFIHYKDLEPGKWVKLLGWGDVDEAHAGSSPKRSSAAKKAKRNSLESSLGPAQQGGRDGKPVSRRSFNVGVLTTSLVGSRRAGAFGPELKAPTLRNYWLPLLGGGEPASQRGRPAGGNRPRSSPPLRFWSGSAAASRAATSRANWRESWKPSADFKSYAVKIRKGGEVPTART